jgi:PAS domain S-box-containing protein
MGLSMLTPMEARRFRSILTRTIVIPCAIMALLIAALLAQLQALLGATELVDHTDAVIAQANSVQRLLIDLETGVRGYLLTGDRVYLEPYNQARGSIDAATADLAQMIADNPEQQQRLAAIEGEYARWNDEAQRLLALRDSGGAYQSSENNLRGKQIMDALRAEIARFIADEMMLRDERVRAVQTTTRLIVGGGVALLLLLGALLAFVSLRQVRAVAQSYRGALEAAQAEAMARQASEEHLRVTLASIGDAVITTDVQGRVTFLNGVAAHLTGWTAADAAGQDITTVFAIVNEHTRQAVENPIQRTLREGRVVGLANHTLLIARDGAERPIDDSGAPIRDSAGAVIGAVLVFRDIAERKQSEEALRVSEERLRIALQASPITVYAQNADLRYTWLYNPSPGYSADETIGKLDSDIAAPEDAARLMALKRQVLATGKGLREEVHVAGVTGELFFDLTIEPLLDANGAVVGVTGAAHDITARKLVENERAALLESEQRAHAEAQEAVRMRDVFFSVAAHELKTPITSLLGNIQLIRRRAAREGFLNERDQRAFDVVNAQTLRLNRMVEALLDVSRLETGQLSLERRPLDVRRLVQQVIADSLPALSQHAIVYEPGNAELLVAGDALRLEQVLQNLIQNAVKYSPDGGDVLVRAWQDGSTAYVAVTDQGIGIPAEAQERLFTRFYRAANVNPQQISGMGIGLYVVKEIVTLHGGTVAVESIENNGSTFTICLPLLERAAERG